MKQHQASIQERKWKSNTMEGSKSFVFVHSLKTIENANLILVIHHGELIESDTHQELL